MRFLVPPSGAYISLAVKWSLFHSQILSVALKLEVVEVQCPGVKAVLVMDSFLVNALHYLSTLCSL